jgi:hypothetical protein
VGKPRERDHFQNLGVDETVNGNSPPRPRHEGIWGRKGTGPLILNLGCRRTRVVFNALAALPAETNPVIH